MIVHVIGASGRSGAALSRALLARGDTVIPVIRNPARWADTGLTPAPRIADLHNAPASRIVLADAEHIVSCAHARHAPVILAAAPADASFVFLGSTRKFTRWPDRHGNGVLAGEAAFLASGRRGVMLHPTMIYGAQGENNVQRLARLLRRLPFVPLPDHGRALVQPIHQDDVTSCVLAALDRRWTSAASLVIAGPAALPYAEFVRAVAYAAGHGSVRIVNLPAPLLLAAARLAAVVPGLPRIGPAEIRRLTEDKAFSITPMQDSLGVAPIALADGLRQLDWNAPPQR